MLTDEERQPIQTTMKPTSAFLCTAMLLAGALPLPAASYVFESRGPAPAGNFKMTVDVTLVPEPTVVPLSALALCGLALRRRR